MHVLLFQFKGLFIVLPFQPSGLDEHLQEAAKGRPAGGLDDIHITTLWAAHGSARAVWIGLT